MIYRLIIFCIMLLYAPWTRSQEIDPLLKERTLYIQASPGDTTSWLPSTYRTYNYNSQRKQIYRNYHVWDTEAEQWSLITEYNYKYDKEGNRVNELIQRFDEKGELLRRMTIESTYSGSMRTTGLLYFEDFFENRWENHSYEYKYDQLGRQTYYSMKYNDSNFISWLWEEYDYFNENGCNNIQVESKLNIYLQDSTNSRDSVVTFFDETCEIQKVEYYQKGIFQPQYQLYYEVKIDRVFDDNDNSLTELYYERSATRPDWNFYYYSLSEYDRRGRVTSITNFDYNSGRGNREINEYNEKDQVVFEKKQFWDLETSSWANQLEYEAVYVRDTILLSYIYRFEWDSNENQYLRYFTLENEYDEDLFLIRKTESQKGLNYDNGEGFFASVETVYNNRCDGAIISSTINEINNNNAPTPYLGRKITNSYYEKAPCNITTGVENNLVIYPNPSHGEINVYNRESFGSSTIAVVNQTGQVVYQDTMVLNNYFSLDLTGLQAGLYVLKIKNGLTETSRKFLLLN